LINETRLKETQDMPTRDYTDDDVFVIGQVIADSVADRLDMMAQAVTFDPDGDNTRAVLASFEDGHYERTQFVYAGVRFVVTFEFEKLPDTHVGSEPYAASMLAQGCRRAIAHFIDLLDDVCALHDAVDVMRNGANGYKYSQWMQFGPDGPTHRLNIAVYEFGND
jgi:hypothetical protein